MEESGGSGGSRYNLRSKGPVVGDSFKKVVFSQSSLDFVHIFNNHKRIINEKEGMQLNNFGRHRLPPSIGSTMKVRSRSGGYRYNLRSTNSEEAVQSKMCDSFVERFWQRLRAKYMEGVASGELVGPCLSPTERKCGHYEGNIVRYDRTRRRCSITALAFFNNSKEAKKVGEFELPEIKDLSSIERGATGVWYHNTGFWYHINFVAKPKNASDDAEYKLFFAELNLCGGYPSTLKCRKCCILGPIDHGYKGCESCVKCSMYVRHPLDG